MSPDGIHHIEVNVLNLARSTEFWSFLLGELGYEPFQAWDGGRSWKRGTAYIVFVQVAQRFTSRSFHRSAVGLNHLAFHGGSRERVDALAEQLRRRGVPMLYDDRYPFAGGREHYALFCEDPDRIKVEVVATQASEGDFRAVPSQGETMEDLPHERLPDPAIHRDHGARRARGAV
ncbi:MAG TPA: VOC family protein [Longimicrobium sp.]